MQEVWIRGNTIKYFNLKDDLLSKIENTEYVAPEKWKKTDQKTNKFKSKHLQ